MTAKRYGFRKKEELSPQNFYLVGEESTGGSGWHKEVERRGGGELSPELLSFIITEGWILMVA
jgi:hypothetical protein